MNLVDCWLVVELVLKEHGLYYLRGLWMIFTLASMTLTLTGHINMNERGVNMTHRHRDPEHVHCNILRQVHFDIDFVHSVFYVHFPQNYFLS